MVSVKSDDQPNPGPGSGTSSEIPASSTLAAPADCARRGRTEDAALGAESLVALMKSMDAGVVSTLVRARELAAGVSKSFPGGDERFANIDSESDDDGDAEEPEEPAEPCKGLFDATMDAGPEKCLRRAATEYSFDLRAELNSAKVPFLTRVRIANFIRVLVRDGHKADDVITQAREAIADTFSPVCTEDKWLSPVLEGDLLLTALEDAESSDEEDDSAAVAETVIKVLT